MRERRDVQQMAKKVGFLAARATDQDPRQRLAKIKGKQLKKHEVPINSIVDTTDAESER